MRLFISCNPILGWPNQRTALPGAVVYGFAGELYDFSSVSRRAILRAQVTQEQYEDSIDEALATATELDLSFIDDLREVTDVYVYASSINEAQPLIEELIDRVVTIHLVIQVESFNEQDAVRLACRGENKYPLTAIVMEGDDGIVMANLIKKIAGYSAQPLEV